MTQVRITPERRRVSLPAGEEIDEGWKGGAQEFFEQFLGLVSIFEAGTDLALLEC